MSEFDFGEGFKPAQHWIDLGCQKRIENAKKSIPFRISFLDDIAIGLLPTDVVVVGAASGAGKTTLGSIISQAAVKHGTRVHYFALEAYEGEIEQRMLYRIMSDLAWENNLEGRGQISFAHWVHGKCDFLSEAYEEQSRVTLKEQLKSFSTYYRTSRFSCDDLVKQMRAIRNESDLIIVDHLHFIDNDISDENRGMKLMVKSISDAVRDTETPVIAIAHLRKKDSRTKKLVPDMHDFHGSSDIVKIATKAIVLAPEPKRDPRQPWLAGTYMRVVKDRVAGESGLTALTVFDMRNNDYQKAYRLGRLNFAGDEFDPIPHGEYPWWAAHAMRVV